MVEAIESKSDLAEICRQTLRRAPEEFLPDLPVDPKVGVAAWRDFEHTAWATGEIVRQALSRHRTWKKDATLSAQVFEVVIHRPLRRGRQSWVMALGFVDAQHLAPLLADLLSDPDVDGHVIDTLLKMRAAGFADQVWPFAHHKRAWIRNLARRYLKRYSAAA